MFFEDRRIEGISFDCLLAIDFKPLNISMGGFGAAEPGHTTVSEAPT